jgi:hypothetical protein
VPFILSLLLLIGCLFLSRAWPDAPIHEMEQLLSPDVGWSEGVER